jgi:branched-chain amino acid transport system ATP-binding protein
MEIIKLVNLRKNFGALTAVNTINLAVNKGELFAIIGPNGAGKTTIFNLITGHLVPSSGKIYFEEKLINNFPPFVISRLGIGRSFQRSSVFLDLTVEENIFIPLILKQKHGTSLFKNVRKEKYYLDKSLSILSKLGLEDKMSMKAKELSHGDKRRLEVGITFASEPKLLLLDEPTSGLSVKETIEMAHLIKEISSDMTTILIEHDMHVVFSISDVICVIHYGEIIAQGKPEDIKKDGNVRKVYLGEKEF